MKKVFSNSDLMHKWSAQTQDYGRNSGGSVYFNGDEIYSYGSHFCMAKIININRPAVLITNRKYGNTTAKHLSWVRSAAPYELVYCVFPNKDFEDNCKAYLSQCETIHAYIDKAKQQRTKARLINELKELGEEIKTYAGAIGETLPEKVLLAIDAEKLAEYNNIKASELAEQAEKRKAYEAEQAAISNKSYNKSKRLFLAGQIEYFTAPSRCTVKGKEYTYLRYNEHKNEVQTSQGVKLPAAVSERFYKWLMAVVAKGGCNDGCNKRLLDWNVQFVNNKEFKIGCHLISMKEAARIATLLNW